MAKKKSNNRLPIDELNNLQSYVKAVVGNNLNVDVNVTEIIDSVEDLLITAFVFGIDSLSLDLGKEISPDLDKMQQTIFKKIEGKTWTERVTEYLTQEGSAEEVNRVIDTETFRVYNEAKYEGAIENGAKFKTWETMQDAKVRDTHETLQSITIPVTDYFYSISGDKALYPHGFDSASENVNCRCFLTFE